MGADDAAEARRRAANRLTVIKLTLHVLERRTELSADQRRLVQTASEATNGLQAELAEHWQPERYRRADRPVTMPSSTRQVSGTQPRATRIRAGRGLTARLASAAAAVVAALAVLAVLGPLLLGVLLVGVVLVAVAAWLFRR